MKEQCKSCWDISEVFCNKCGGCEKCCACDESPEDDCCPECGGE